MADAEAVFVKVARQLRQRRFFPAVRRPGSVTGEAATRSKQAGALIPVRLDRFLQQIRFAPADDPFLADKIEQVLKHAGLDVLVQPSILDIRKS
jgi:hypothetical protein